MKIAIAAWKGKISPVFDSTAHILVADIEDNKITNQELISLEYLTHYQRVELLDRLGIRIFVCGGITRPLLENIRSKDIVAIPNICGDVDKILKAISDEKNIKKLFSVQGTINKENL